MIHNTMTQYGNITWTYKLHRLIYNCEKMAEQWGFPGYSEKKNQTKIKRKKNQRQKKTTEKTTILTISFLSEYVSAIIIHMFKIRYLHNYFYSKSGFATDF